MNKTMECYEDFVVLPRKLVIDPIIDTGDGDSETLSQNNFSLDKNAFASIREYRAEDSIKNVHWTMSAKHDKLMVKQMERSIGGSCVIIPDLNEYFPFDEDNYDATDSIIEVMLALDLSLISMKQRCLNAWYIESEDCITISELTEKFIKAEISFDKALDIVKKKKIIYAPDATMQAMLSDKKGRVLIIEPGIGYRYEQENFSLITNYSILKPDITKPYIVSGDTRYEVAKELLAGYDKDFSVNDAFKVLKSVSQKDLWATRVSFVYSTEKNKVYYVLNNDFSNVFEFQF